MTFEYFLLNYSTILPSVFLSPETLLSEILQVYSPAVHPTVNKGLKLTSEFCDPSFTLGDCSKTDSGRWDSEKKGYIAVAALAKAKAKAKDKHTRMQRTHRKQERVNRLKTAHSFTFLVYRSAQLIVISFKVNTVASLEIWNANNNYCILPDAPLH